MLCVSVSTSSEPGLSLSLPQLYGLKLSLTLAHGQSLYSDAVPWSEHPKVSQPWAAWCGHSQAPWAQPGTAGLSQLGVSLVDGGQKRLCLACPSCDGRAELASSLPGTPKGVFPRGNPKATLSPFAAAGMHKCRQEPLCCSDMPVWGGLGGLSTHIRVKQLLFRNGEYFCGTNRKVVCIRVRKDNQ